MNEYKNIPIDRDHTAAAAQEAKLEWISECVFNVDIYTETRCTFVYTTQKWKAKPTWSIYQLINRLHLHITADACVMRYACVWCG